MTTDAITAAEEARGEAEAAVRIAQEERDPDAEETAWQRLSSASWALDAARNEERAELARRVDRLLPAAPAADPLEAELAALIVDHAEAADLGDRGRASELAARIDQLEVLRSARSRDAEHARLAASEKERRAEVTAMSAAATAEATRRAEVDRVVAHRHEIAAEVDRATNNLTTLIGAYRAATEDLEILDHATPWAADVRRLGEWLGHRLSLATGGRGGFERARTDEAAAHSFAADPPGDVIP